MVTQELARKKQQEFESSLLQNLQHVFLLSKRPLPRVLHPVLLWGLATPTSSAQRGVSGKGEEVIQGCTVRRDTCTPTHRQMVQSPPLAPTGHLLLSHRAGASLPFQGLSSLLLRIRRVPQRPGFHESC